MTTPAEDPRSGEGHNYRAADCEALEARTVFPALRQSCPACNPPAAGRGDTDSGGEDAGLAYLEGLAAHSDNPTLLRAVEDVRTEILAARPAGDRAQPKQEVLDDLVQVVLDWSWEPGVVVTDTQDAQLRDALARPLAALLDAQAAVNRVEAVMARCNEARAHAAAFDRPDESRAYDVAGEWIRRALDGTT